MNFNRVMVLVGSLLLIVGALLPWGQMGMLSLTGISGDGIFSFGLGVILLIGAIAVKEKPGKMYSIWLAILGLLASSLMCMKTYNMMQVAVVGQSASMIEIGAGIWVSLLGAGLCLLGGLLQSPGEKKSE